MFDEGISAPDVWASGDVVQVGLSVVEFIPVCVPRRMAGWPLGAAGSRHHQRILLGTGWESSGVVSGNL